MKLLPPIKTSLEPIDVEAKPIDSNKLFDIEKVTKVLLKIEKKTIKIDKLLKRSLNSRLRNDRLLRTRREQQSFDQREQELEQKKPKESKKLNIKFPRAFGIFDWIKNFLFNVILGFIAVRLIKFLPNLIGLLPIISKAADFIIDIGGKLLNGLVTFIDWGYKAYDSTRGFVRNIFGEDGAKKFDDLASKFNTFMNLAIIAGMAATGLGSGRGGRSGFGGGRGRPGGRPGVTQSGGGRAGRPDIRNPLRERPNVTQSGGGRAGRPDIRNPLRGRPNITGTLTEGAGGTAARGAGRFGAKLGTLGTKGIPIIGPLLDFGIRTLVLGESPGRAAAGAVGVAVGQILGSIVGTWIGGAIGGIAGSVVPFIGNLLVGGAGAAIGGIVGELAGAFLGDMLGTSLYDLVFQSGGSKHMAEGGSATTRSSNLSGPSTRTLSKKKVQRTVTPVPRKIKPGASAGGEKKYQEMFPDTDDQQKDKKDSKKKQNPFQYSLKSSEILGKTNFFGPLFSLALKSHLGDLPTDVDYTLAAKGLNSWLNSTMDFRAIAAAGGGTIDVESFGNGEDYTRAIADSIKESATPQIDKTNKELKRNLSLKKVEPPADSTPTEEKPAEEQLDENGEPLPGATTGKWGPILDLISKTEGGYDSLNPGLHRPQILNMSINELVAFQNQSKSQYGGTAAAGRYQFLYPESAAKLAGVPLTAKFTKDVQDKLAVGYLEKKRRGASWLSGKITDESFMQDLADEWASLPNAQGRFSYGGQSSSTTPKMVREALSKVRRGGYSQTELAGSNSYLGSPDLTSVQRGDPSNATIRLKREFPGIKKAKTPQQIYASGLGFWMKKNFPTPGEPSRRGKGDYGDPPGGDMENPDHGGVVATHHGQGHYKGVALDLGGFGDPHGKDQDKMWPYIAKFLKIYGLDNKYTVPQVLSAENEHYSPSAPGSGWMPGHSDHLHVEFAKGGVTPDGPTRAIIGEKGKEYVIDADSYKAAQNLIPGVLDILNYKVKNTETLKKNIPSIISSLQKYAPYEPEVNHLVIFNNNQPSSGSSHSSYSEAPSLSRSNIDSRTDQFQILNMV